MQLLLKGARGQPLWSFLLLLLYGLIASNFLTFSGTDFEHFATAHYMPGFEQYYGGYGGK